MLLSFSRSVLLFLSCFAVRVALVDSHGMMCGPRQRAAYASEDKCGSTLSDPKDSLIDYCGHCLNGGPKDAIINNLPPEGWKVYEPLKDFPGSAGRAGLCGDIKGNDDHMLGGSFMPYDTVPMVENYKKGGVVDFTAELDTNHNGYFEFFLCNLDACGTSDLEDKCFMEGHCHKLLRVKHPDCENPSKKTHDECGPVDPKYPGRWYVPCRKTGHVGVHIVGGDKGTMRYKLPDNVECKHCVVQWYWATANSCAPRGFLDYFEAHNEPFGNTCDSDGGGRGAYRPGMAECGGDLIPEEFWSCADVQITKDGNAAGAVESMGEPDSGSSDDEPEAQTPPESPAPSASPLTDPLPENETETTANSGESSESDSDGGSSDGGACLEPSSPCDGTVPCCDMKQVCVYSEDVDGFQCRYWRDLWKDVKQREAEM